MISSLLLQMNTKLVKAKENEKKKKKNIIFKTLPLLISQHDAAFLIYSILYSFHEFIFPRIGILTLPLFTSCLFYAYVVYCSYSHLSSSFLT